MWYAKRPQSQSAHLIGGTGVVVGPGSLRSNNLAGRFCWDFSGRDCGGFGDGCVWFCDLKQHKIAQMFT